VPIAESFFTREVNRASSRVMLSFPIRLVRIRKGTSSEVLGEVGVDYGRRSLKSALHCPKDVDRSCKNTSLQ